MITNDTIVQSFVVLSAFLLSHWRIKERIKLLEVKVDRLEALLELLVHGKLPDSDPISKMPELIRSKAGLVGLVAVMGLSIGCARFTTVVSSADGSTTKVSAYTLFDSKSELAKLAAGQGARTNAQHVTVGSLNQESTTTNLNSILSDVVAAAIKAAKP